MGIASDNGLVDTTSVDVFDEVGVGLMPLGASERDAQEYIISFLVQRNGFVRGAAGDINPVSGLDCGRIVNFVRVTQPDVWEFFCQYSEPERELCDVVRRHKETWGTLSLLKDGVPAEGARPHMSLMFNVSALNAEQNVLWEQNCFVVYDEVKYETNSNPTKRIDLVIGVNGVPFQAVELKNELTGQSSVHAEEQFRLTRSNHEPLLRPVTGCVTFFSMSRREVGMATVLRGPLTKFLPFNKGGKDGGKGNPSVEDQPECNGFRTHYMLDEIWTKECLTDLVFKFMYVENEKSLAGATISELENVPVVFPRYHQVRLVRRMVRDIENNVRASNFGGAFLVQHSAGSGKTLSISWLAHQLVRLVDDGGASIFDGVIVVTDRVTIVRQLEKAVRMLNRHDGLVAEVKNSRGLGEAIKNNKRIIVTSIQKFGRLNKLVETLGSVNNKRFAVLIDEAHSGQGGANAASVVELLGKSVADELAELGSHSPNLVYAAFTATPRAVTLAKFGQDNKAYDLYSMKQAIEEGQILNVLKNYVSVHMLNKVWNDGDNQELPSSIYAKRAINSYVRTSEVNLEFKAATILESMGTNTLLNIGGLGRGMVVTSGREDVYKYVQELRRQIAENPDVYGAVKVAGAYTGTLEIDGQKVDDSKLNGFNTDEIPSRISIEDPGSDKMINLLVVADKYQTGFDEPLLCSMYVDKKLRGINAVQTLNRLNRIRRQGDKENVLIVDFQENEDAVRKAFAEYGVEARVKTMSTVNDLESSALALYAYGVFNIEQISAYYNARKNITTDPLASTTMSNVINKVLDNMDTYLDSTDRDTKEEFENFRYEMRNYLEDFVFVSQFKEVTDIKLKGLYTFLKLLVQLLKAPRRSLGNTEWLENIRVEIVHSEIVNQNLSSFSQAPEPQGETEKRGGASHKNPLEYDAPITVEELVEDYNNRLKAMILAATGKTSADDGTFTPEDLAGLDFNVFETIVNRAAQDPRLEEYSRNRSSQRFESPNTQQIIKPIILQELTKDKIANKDNPDYANISGVYGKDAEFATRFNKYVLSAVYQILLRKRINKNKTTQ